MEAELEAYEYQLSQVKLSLEADPGNVELTTLKGELEEIIDLTKQALGVSGTKAAGVAEGSSKGKGKSKEKGFKAGDEVSARYKDMKWYPARITAISGPSDNLSYTLIFKGYTTPITLPAVCLKPISEQPAESLELAPPSTLGGVKRKLSAAEEEKEREKRKKKNDKWAEKQKEKTQETLQKKSAWESFGKKAAKKGHKIGGLEGKSIFRTPDNPTVGVVGSGQGVTSYDKMGKHKFNAAGQRED